MRTGDAEKDVHWKFVLKNESDPSSIARINENFPLRVPTWGNYAFLGEMILLKRTKK